jgi:hypothetical protein
VRSADRFFKRIYQLGFRRALDDFSGRAEYRHLRAYTFPSAHREAR